MQEKRSNLADFAFLLADLFSLAVSFFLSYRFRFGSFIFSPAESWTDLLLILLFLDIIITLVINPYQDIFFRSYYLEIKYCLQLTVYNLLSAAILFYLLKIGADFSRIMMGMTYLLYFSTSLILKYILKKIIVTHQERFCIPLFIIGSRKNIESVIEDINANDFRIYDIRGVCLTDDPSSKGSLSNIPIINEPIVDFVIRNNISEVLSACPPTEIDVDLQKKLSENGINIFFDVDSIAGFHPEFETLHSFGIIRTLGVGGFSFSSQQTYYLIFKQIFDILFGLAGCALLLPIYIIIRTAYLISGDRSKIIYTQKRVGRGGKAFNLYKFRSMVPDADEMLNEVLSDEKNRREWEENQKLSDDPRITRIGRFLRRTSIDELPQLLNVIKGEMSLVGPRPLVEGELEAHNGLKLYQKVKPGITGWWGCNGRSNISYQERLELEYYYVKHISLYLDSLCVIRTLFSIWKREGAI